MYSLLGTAMTWVGGRELGVRDEKARDEQNLKAFRQEIKEADERQKRRSVERDMLDAMRPGRVVRDPEWERTGPLTAHSPQNNDPNTPTKTPKSKTSRKVLIEEEAAARGPREFMRWSSESLVSITSEYSLVEASDEDDDSHSAPSWSEDASPASCQNTLRFSLDGFSDKAYYSPDRAWKRRQYLSLPPPPKYGTDWGSLEPEEHLPIVQTDTIWHTNRPWDTLGPDSKGMRGIGRYKLYGEIDLEEIRKRMIEDLKGPNAVPAFGPGKISGPHHPLETMYYLRASEVVEDKIKSGELSHEERGPVLFKLWRDLQIDLVPTLESVRYRLGCGVYSRTVAEDGHVITTGFGEATGATLKELRAVSMSRANYTLAQEALVDRPLSPTKRPGRRVTFDADIIDPPDRRKLEAERPLRRSLSDLTHAEKAKINSRNIALDAEDAVEFDDDYLSDSDMSCDTESDCSGYEFSPLTRMPSKELTPPSKGILKVCSRPVSPDLSHEQKCGTYKTRSPASAAQYVRKPTLDVSKSFTAQLEAEDRFARLEKAGVLRPVGSDDFIIESNGLSTAPYMSGAINDDSDISTSAYMSGAINDYSDDDSDVSVSDDGSFDVKEPMPKPVPASTAVNERRISGDSAVAMPNNEKPPPSTVPLRPAIKKSQPSKVPDKNFLNPSPVPSRFQAKPKGARVSFSSHVSTSVYSNNDLVSSLKRNY